MPTISFDRNFVDKACQCPVPKKITLSVCIGCIVDDNPDLNHTQIKDVLFGLEDYTTGNVKKYQRGMLNN